MSKLKLGGGGWPDGEGRAGGGAGERAWRVRDTSDDWNSLDKGLEAGTKASCGGYYFSRCGQRPTRL